METNTLVESYLTMLNTRDATLVDQFVAEGYINHNTVVGDGRETNRRFWAAFFTGLPDVTASLEDLIVDGDRVVGRFIYRGTHTGELLGIPATGKQVEMRTIDIWRVENDMFIEHWDELNLLEVFQQIGILPALPTDLEVR